MFDVLRLHEVFHRLFTYRAHCATFRAGKVRLLMGSPEGCRQTTGNRHKVALTPGVSFKAFYNSIERSTSLFHM